MRACSGTRDRATLEAGCTPEGKYSAPYEYGMPDASGLTDRSPFSSGRHQPSHPTVPLWNDAGEPRGKHRQEFGVRQFLKDFFDDESGATAIEYCMIATGLSIVIVTVVNNIGSTLSTRFADMSSSLK
jgi:pilus assembly protein Flp/PilA